MPIIAITGSIGAGKTSALQCFSALGARTTEADQLAHQLYRPGSRVHQQILARWGGRVIAENDEIDRSALAEIVFQQPNELQWLNQQVHPQVKEEIMALAHRHPDNLWCAIPLLFEVGWEKQMHRTVSVWCSREIQTSRLLSRGWTNQEINRRLAHHWNDADKATAADYVIINQGSVDNLRTQCRIIYDKVENTS